MITVIKYDHKGDEVWRYEGEILERTATSVCVEAHFQRGTVDIGPLVFEQGDRLVEWFYTHRWYNIFELHHHETDALKGWYCNITRPADLTESTVASEDLALDVLVTAAGQIVLKDEAEYEALDLTPTEREATHAALAELRQRVAQRHPPFDKVPPN